MNYSIYSPAEQAQTTAIERAERWEDNEEVPHVINFQDRSRLRELLTDRRIELLGEVMEHPAESIRALADRLNRDVHDVRDNLHLLAEYAIVYCQRPHPTSLGFPRSIEGGACQWSPSLTQTGESCLL
jgi:Predicted transcriptional regulator